MVPRRLQRTLLQLTAYLAAGSLTTVAGCITVGLLEIPLHRVPFMSTSHALTSQDTSHIKGSISESTFGTWRIIDPNPENSSFGIKTIYTQADPLKNLPADSKMQKLSHLSMLACDYNTESPSREQALNRFAYFETSISFPFPSMYGRQRIDPVSGTTLENTWSVDTPFRSNRTDFFFSASSRMLPLRPIMPGFAWSSVTWSVIIFLISSSCRMLRIRGRRSRGLCVARKCAYPLEGAAICPECGTPAPDRPAATASS